MTNVFLLRFREYLILEKYEPVGAKQCLPFASLYPAMNMKTCVTSQIAASLENVKVCLHKKNVKHDMESQGPYGYCLKRLYRINWCWDYTKHHFLHHNKLVVEEFNSERKKGSIRYHFTLEALRLKEKFEGLRLGTDRQFNSFRALDGKFAGVGVQTPPPSLEEAIKSVDFDHTFIYIVRSKNNKNPAGKVAYPIPKQCCFFISNST
jgi:hypothetical protein